VARNFIATKRLREAIALKRVDGVRQVDIGIEAGFPHASTTSQIVCGLLRVADDVRVRRLCDLAGVPFAEAFREVPAASPLGRSEQHQCA
jgi:hypothetical protein